MHCSVSYRSSPVGRTPARISLHSSPWNLFMKHNQTRSRVGDPLRSALPHRSAQRIHSPRSGCALGSRCAETPGGNAARTFFFFFLLAINLEEKSASCIPQGDRKGGSSPSAAPLVPLTPFFFTASPSPHLYPGHFACSWHKALAQGMLQKGAWGDCELTRDKVWGRELIKMFSHILPGRGILAGRRLWVSLSLFLCADLLHARGWGLRNVPLQWIREEHMRVSQSGQNICTST